MRSLNPDRPMLSTRSDSIDTGILASDVNLGRLSTRRDDRVAGGPLRVAGGVGYAVTSSIIPATVMLSDGTQITFDSVVAQTRVNATAALSA